MAHRQKIFLNQSVLRDFEIIANLRFKLYCGDTCVCPCVRVSSVRSVHSVRGSPVQLGTLDTAHLLSPGRPAPSTVKLQRFLSLFVKLSLSSSSAVLSCLVITRSPALCQFALWCLTSFLTIQQHMGDIKFASMQFYEISPLVCSQHSTN